MRSKLSTRPAPVKGLILGQAARPDPAGAEVLENWIPTRRGVRVRGGRTKVATLDSPVTSIFTYTSAGITQAFAATESSLFPVTPDAPDIVPTAIRDNRSSGTYITHQMGTPGGQFLLAANGADPVLTYDGSNWTDTLLTFSPTGSSSSDLSFVWGYRNRLFFIEKNSMKVWFLPVNQVAGELLDFSLAGVFQLGGSLLFGATISFDAGDGVDDRIVFVSNQGEVAVYAGADPADPNDWRLVGRYEIGIPLGPQGFMRAGGDLLILTVSGAVSLTRAMQSDTAALMAQAVTEPIEPLWTLEAQRRTAPWQIEKWSERSLAVVSTPGMDRGRSLVLSLDTGAWGVATNWEIKSLGLFGDRMLAGIDNSIFALDEGGLDDDAPFVAKLCMSFAGVPDNVRKKVASLMRGTYFSRTKAIMKFGIASDFEISFPDPPAASQPSPDPQLWGNFTWGVSVWSALRSIATKTFVTRWAKVRGSGISLAPTVQVTSGNESQLFLELVQIDFQSESGGTVR